VHELHNEVGHSRATIELLNNLSDEQKSRIGKIETISYSSSPLNKLFPWKGLQTEVVKVPLKGLYPFVLKAFFYHVWTFFFHLLRREKNVVSLSVGVAFLFPDIVNIQFIHHHWDELNPLYRNSVWYKKLYKRILFIYLNFCESYVYKRTDVFYSVLSRFTHEYLMKKFNVDKNHARLIYSSVNLSDFFCKPEGKDKIRDQLLKETPSLAELDLKKPIALFVGAYERKGLPRAIELLSKLPEIQFLIVGKPESGSKPLKIPDSMKVVRVPFTQQLNAYYNLADVFVFPTIYEPFGLVMLEAAATGLKLVLPRKNSGASELLETDPETYFLDDENFTFPALKVLSSEERKMSIMQRRTVIDQYSWIKSSDLFFKEILSNFL
jgi:glycosyltransferase involved in cell wall biosynthesis